MALYLNQRWVKEISFRKYRYYLSWYYSGAAHLSVSCFLVSSKYIKELLSFSLSLDPFTSTFSSNKWDLRAYWECVSRSLGICLTVLLINRRDNIYRFTENFPIIRFIKRNEVSLFYNLFDPQILYIYILYVDWLWDLRKRKLTGSNNGMVFCIHLRGCHRNQ